MGISNLIQQQSQQKTTVPKKRVVGIRIIANFNQKFEQYSFYKGKNFDSTLRLYHNGAIRRNSQSTDISYFSTIRVCSENSGFSNFFVVYEDGSSSKLSEDGIIKAMEIIHDVDSARKEELTKLAVGDVNTYDQWNIDHNSTNVERDFEKSFQQYIHAVIQATVFKFQFPNELGELLEKASCEAVAIQYFIPFGIDFPVGNDDYQNVIVAIPAGHGSIELSNTVFLNASVYIKSEKMEDAFSKAATMPGTASSMRSLSNSQLKAVKAQNAEKAEQRMSKNAWKKQQRKAAQIAETVESTAAETAVSTAVQSAPATPVVKPAVSAADLGLNTEKNAEIAAKGLNFFFGEEDLEETTVKSDTYSDDEFGFGEI